MSISPLHELYAWRSERVKALKKDMMLARQAAGRLGSLTDSLVRGLNPEQRLALDAAHRVLTQLDAKGTWQQLRGVGRWGSLKCVPKPMTCWRFWASLVESG
jgi:hypothetical protein